MISIRNFNPALQEHMMRGIYGNRQVDEYLRNGGSFVQKGTVNRVGRTLARVSKPDTVAAKPDTLQQAPTNGVPALRNAASSPPQSTVN